MGMKMVKDNRDVKPLILKLGVALALSFAGFLYSHIRNTRIRPTTRSPPSPPTCSSDEKAVTRSSCIDTALITSENKTSTSLWLEEASHPKINIDNPFIGFSPHSRHFEEEEGFLMPEFNNLVLEELEIPPIDTGASLEDDDIGTPTTIKIASNKEMEQEIINLRTMVRDLRERERNLEFQLLEYYGLKEQDTTIMELQNRLKISTMETKLFTLKIESLQANNKKLEAQLADYSKVMAELESARMEIKLLKGKVRSDVEQNKEQLSTLQQKVMNLHDQEHESTWEDKVTQNKLQKLMELEEELIDLRSINSRLQLENSNLERKLEPIVDSAAVSEVPRLEALEEANHRLRQQNNDLMKEIEQLQVNHCADVEELVYLRWVNACLRYELRNYQGPPGKTVARELSRTLSPRSEEKAKKLILEYSNSEGIDKGMSLMDFDSGYWSSSQDSNGTESVDLDDTSVDVSSATRTNSSTKSKFFSKLKRLVRGKESHKLSGASTVNRVLTSGRRKSDSAGSFQEMRRSYSCGSASSQPSLTISAKALTTIESKTDEQRNKITLTSHSLLRPSLDIERMRNRNLEDIRDVEGYPRNSDVGSSYGYKRLVQREGSDNGLPQDYLLDQDPNASEKQKLMKFAKVLGGSHATSNSHKRSTSNSHKRSTSYSSY